MRVSILVNSVDPTACHDYAVLWLDPVQRVWTRQACVGIALPPEGAIVDNDDDATRLVTAGPDAAELLSLRNFHVNARDQLTAIAGAARWFSLSRHSTIDGRWHLRAVERFPAAPNRPRAASGSVSPPPWRRAGERGEHQPDCR